MITIGQLAGLAQTSVRTLHHYHQVGILPEPERDVSGYRRYGVRDLIRVLQIRNLADVGVPLADIPALLDADESERGSTFDRLDAALAEREAFVRAQRERLARVRRAQGGPPVGDHIADAWRRLTELGLSGDAIRDEVEATLLLRALTGETDAGGLLDEMYRRMDAARDLPPDDPRVDAIVDETVAYLLEHAETRARMQEQDAAGLVSESVLRAYIETLPPAVQRIVREIEERVREGLGG